MGFCDRGNVKQCLVNIMRHVFIEKNNLLVSASFAALLGAFCLQYYVDFGNMLSKWNDPDFTYCYLVPLIFLYLVYVKRDSLKTDQVNPSMWGFVVLLFSGVLYLAGKFGSIVTLSYIAIWVSVIGLALLLLGIKIVKKLAFPFVILGFIVPLPPFLNQLFTFKLRLISSALSVKVMQLGGLSVFREGNIIDLGVTELQVVDACSGLRYVYPLLLMGLIFACLFHKKWWKRGVIILATIPISVFSNTLRIAVTGFLTIKVSQQAAESFFHGFSGWIIFMVSIVFLSLLSWLLNCTKSRSIAPGSASGKRGNPGFVLNNLKNLRQSYLWLASVMLIIFWGLNNALALAQVEPTRKTFEEFPTVIGDWKGEKLHLRDEILKSLWADDYIQIQYHNTNTNDALLLFVPYYAYQGTRHTAHSPFSCLVGGGFAPRSRKVIERLFPEPFGRVRIRQMVLEKDRELLLSNYWFQQRGRIILSEYWNKWYLFWDSIVKRRTDGALVRIEMPLQGSNDVESAQALIDSFTLKLMKILPKYVPAS